MSPAGKVDERPINYLLQDKLANPVIHTGDVRRSEPPENTILSQQHQSLVLFIHHRWCCWCCWCWWVRLGPTSSCFYEPYINTKAKGEATSDLLVLLWRSGPQTHTGEAFLHPLKVQRCCSRVPSESEGGLALVLLPWRTPPAVPPAALR